MSGLVPRATVARLVSRRGDVPVDRFWMERCEGFHVATASGVVGVVEQVLLDGVGAPRQLVVLAGTIRLHRLVVSVKEVSEIDPEHCAVWLASEPGPHRSVDRSLRPRIQVGLGCIHTP